MTDSPSPDDRPPICREFLERFRERPEFLARLFEVFLAEEPGRMARIEAAVAADDREAVRFLAHSLKGASATMGMERLRDACRGLEFAVKEDRPERLSPCCALVRSEIEAVFAAMRAGTAK
jgi:HPt (histidine-containing phosphotransfer) domain-containing protein